RTARDHICARFLSDSRAAPCRERRRGPTFIDAMDARATGGFTMNKTLTVAPLAGTMIASTPSQAQMGGVRQLGQGQQPEKKPQYVPGAKAQEKVFPLGTTWTAVSLNGKSFSGGDRPSFIVDT